VVLVEEVVVTDKYPVEQEIHLVLHLVKVIQVEQD
jgi:hypothetical protein